MLKRVLSMVRMGEPHHDDGGLLFDSGATVPTDATAGYRTGCIFQHSDGGEGTALYINEGSVTSCNFNPVDAGGTIAHVLGATDTFSWTCTDVSAPVVMTNTITTAGKTGGRALFHVKTNVAMGGWANGVKGYWEATGTSGRVTGLASGVCAELKTANAALASGAYYPIEAEYVAGGTSVVSTGSGSRVGFIYMQHSGDINGDFDDNGYLFTAAGLTAGAGHLLSAQSITLKCQVGLAGAESTRYLVMSSAENNLTLATTGGTSISIGTCTTGISIGTTTTSILFNVSGGSVVDAAASLSIYGGGTNGDSLILQGASTQATQKITIVGGTGTTVTGALASTGALTAASLVCTAGATFGGGAAATGVTISTDGIVTMGAQGTGVTIASATPFGLEVHSQHASDVVAGATGLSCGIRSRYEISVAQTTLASLVAIEGRLRVKAALADGNHAGVMGTIESDDSIAFTGTSTTQRSAGAFAIELGASCTLSAGFLCGIAIDSSVNGNVDMSNVEFCGIRIKTSSSKEIWEHGLYIDDGGAVTGITLGTCTTGISIGVCATAAIDIDTTVIAIDASCSAIGADGRIAKFAGSCAAGNMGDGYGAVETELTLSGTVAGAVAASSTWINVTGTSVDVGSQTICVRNDGIYVTAADTPMSSATAIIGGRLQYVADGGGAPAALYLWQTNIYDNVITALINVNDKVDIGWTTGLKSGGTMAGSVPLFKDKDGNTHYVNTWID